MIQRSPFIHTARPARAEIPGSGHGDAPSSDSGTERRVEFRSTRRWTITVRGIVIS